MKADRWRQIDTLLGEALQLEASRRAAFLDIACEGDDELRERVDSLVAAHQQAESFIEVPALAMAAEALAEEARSMVGSRLMHYQISALIGAGGMGAVWKARDTRLDRDVAIKTLPEGLSLRRDWLARFEREAKILASLHHPNIAVIHGLEEDRGKRFLVLEFVEGETLADRLLRGALPLNESLSLARQISEALEAAHEKGIIHRDLKPNNIKVTADGTVKVLDFGLAKSLADDDGHLSSINLQPQGISSTSGAILGTAAYMAPEQTRGGKLDRRADIWAFGAVLYEMLTGLRAFQGIDSNETIASVAAKEPDYDRAPSTVRRLLQKCLEKDPKNRLRDIGDAWALVNEPNVATDVDAAQPRGRYAPLAWFVAAILGIVAVASSLLLLQQDPLPEVERFTIHAPSGSLLPPGPPAISIDGSKLAYVVLDSQGVRRLYVRAIDALEGKPLPGTEGAVHPFWSPAGDSIAFAARSRLLRIDLANGSIHDLTGIAGMYQGGWNQQDDIVIRTGSTLSRISAHGGVTASLPNSSGTAFPAFLSDGNRLLMRVIGDHGDSIQLGALGSAERTLVLDNVESAPIVARTPEGKSYLLILQESNLMAYPFNESSGKTLGNPELLVPNIAKVGNPSVMPAIGVSPAGHLAYQTTLQGPTDDMTMQLTLVDRTGHAVRTFSSKASVFSPRISPNQSLVAGVRPTGGRDIWTLDLVRGTSDRKTYGDNSQEFPVWSNDNSRIAFQSGSDGVYSVDVAGHTEPKLLTEIPAAPTSWWGHYLLYTYPSGPRGRIYMLDTTRGGQPMQVGSPIGNSAGGEFSPDGAYIAFDSDRTGTSQVYIQNRTGTEELQVSIDGGKLARWRGDGRELFFISRDGYLMAVGVKRGHVLSVGTPQKLFPFEPLKFRNPYGARVGYDVTRDGRKFLIGTEPKDLDLPITVVRNWWVEMKNRPGR